VSRAVWTGSVPVVLETIIGDLPSETFPELMGAYGHSLKNIAISGDQLFVSVASATNADVSDILATPTRAAIHVYPVDGGTGRLYAKGLRNAEGLALHPRTGELWAAVNHRDNLRYPLHDGRFEYGSQEYGYINDNPPEPFTRVRDGANYGWPYCNPTADNGNDAMPYVPDYDNNPDESVVDCDGLDRIDKGLPAHSAPLGLSFWTGAMAPAGYRDGALIGMHGCWNCSVPRGYKVVFLPMRDDGFEDPIDLVIGFLSDATDRTTAWGRPVDVIPNRRGDLYISDDRAGAVYELYRPTR
jgi:glucose/arabinose dehydrogenase